MISSRMGRSAIGTRGFGSTAVYGRRRVPLPPARITALIGSPGVAAAPALARGRGRGEREVAVVERARLDIGEDACPDHLDQPLDRSRHGALGDEAQPLPDLREG